MFETDFPLKRLLATSLIAASSVAASASPAVSAAPASATTSISVASSSATNWIDTSDRAGVLTRYNQIMSAPAPDMNWTGNRATCDAGTTNPAYRAHVVNRVNYFRAMAGLPANVSEDEAMSTLAQLTSIMNAESGKLDHNPDTSFTCYNADAASTAGLSNLYLGRSGADAINGYVQDPGANNFTVGHRNWVLSPTLRYIGIGDIPAIDGWAANTLTVIEDSSIVFGAQPQMRQEEGYVAWPPEGYVPHQIVYERWSFSLRYANFSNAAITATVNGQSVPVSVEHRSTQTTGAPFPIMVWSIPSLPEVPAEDVVVGIHISGVVLNGVATSYTYETTVIGESAPTQYNAFVNQAYEDFLGRSATPQELTSWGAALATGTSRYDFVATLARSEEWTTVVVQDLYVGTLGREADAEGASYWASQLRNGRSVASTASQFYGSPEYVQAEGGSWSGWITDLYHELMNRSPDSSGLGYWKSQAELRGSGLVAYDFYQSGESRRARVQALYQKLLGRNSDPAGLDYWADVLKSGDDLALASFLASSDEYFTRAG